MSIYELDEHGFEVVPDVLSPDQCDDAVSCVEREIDFVASRSLLILPWCARIAQSLKVGVLARFLAPEHVAVQCTLFRKSLDHNWLVPVHQDLSVPVAQRVAEPSLRGWSEKDGDLFVQPPPYVLEQLLAVRLHLDPCSIEDGSLKVVPGSHRQGRITSAAAVEMRTNFEVTCAASRGAALLMRPLLLHGSSKSLGQSQRRVLQFVFGPPTLPHGLQWQHAI